MRCEACNSGLHDVRKQLNPMQVALIRSLPEPGETLFWDLLQDDKRPLLVADVEEKVITMLIHLLASVQSPCCVKYRFICACIENLSRNRSVNVCFRLVPAILNLFLPQHRQVAQSRGALDGRTRVRFDMAAQTVAQRAMYDVSANWRDIEAHHQVWTRVLPPPAHVRALAHHLVGRDSEAAIPYGASARLVAPS